MSRDNGFLNARTSWRSRWRVAVLIGCVMLLAAGLFAAPAAGGGPGKGEPSSKPAGARLPGPPLGTGL
jgi:hypothetical protein